MTIGGLRWALNIPIIFHKAAHFFSVCVSRRIIHFVDIYTQAAYCWPLSNGLRRKLRDTELFWFGINLTVVLARSSYSFLIHHLPHRRKLMDVISINAVAHSLRRRLHSALSEEKMNIKMHEKDFDRN